MKKLSKAKKVAIILSAIAAIMIATGCSSTGSTDTNSETANSTTTAVSVESVSSEEEKKGPDLKMLYDEYCDADWAEVGSDGSYLTLDTNPRDKVQQTLTHKDNTPTYVITALGKINSALGLPDSLLSQDIAHTTAADGKQSETFEDAGVTVTWKYHPDTGLLVTYKTIY